jgi:uncharacterized damage-inducible protein DinB
MYTSAALLDLHGRAHQTLTKLIDHCGGFSPDELNRELEGFGYPSIRRQLHHMIWAEDVWMCVLRGSNLTEQHPGDFPSLDDLRAYRDSLRAATADFLRSATDGELSVRRMVTLGEGKRRELMPAQVILRIVTHLFQHQGQVAVMARLLGRPVPPGLDFDLGV